VIHLQSRRLNLGCGFDKRPGYLNVDLQSFHAPDIVADVLALNDFPSGYYEEIIAQDVLEHFKRVDTRKAFYEWNRVLALGGSLYVRTTYLNGLLRMLESPDFQTIELQELLVHCLFSTQVYEGDFHLTAFTEPLFRFYLWETGFEITELRVQGDWLFEAHARKVTDYSFAELESEANIRRFVKDAYRQILFRRADQVGLTHFSKALETNVMTRREVIKYLLHSDERKTRMIAKAPTFRCVCGDRPRVVANPAPEPPKQSIVGWLPKLGAMLGLRRAG
jgi:hypothetical protein